MNRLQRLQAALDGTGIADQAAGLATLPAAQVDLIVAAIRASRRAALVADKARRRQHVADRRRYGHVEDAQQAAATQRQTLALARRAGSNLDTLARLAEHYDDGPAVLALAVAGLRAEGYSDGEIGAALGISRQAVWKRLSRQPEVDARTGGNKGHGMTGTAGAAMTASFSARCAFHALPQPARKRRRQRLREVADGMA